MKLIWKRQHDILSTRTALSLDFFIRSRISFCLFTRTSWAMSLFTGGTGECPNLSWEWLGRTRTLIVCWGWRWWKSHSPQSTVNTICLLCYTIGIVHIVPLMHVTSKGRTLKMLRWLMWGWCVALLSLHRYYEFRFLPERKWIENLERWMWHIKYKFCMKPTMWTKVKFTLHIFMKIKTYQIYVSKYTEKCQSCNYLYILNCAKDSYMERCFESMRYQNILSSILKMHLLYLPHHH